MLRSNAGKIFHYIEGKYALLQRTYRVCIQTPALLPKFCYYYICSSLPAHIEKYINKGAIPNILRPMLTDFPVPLPPLEVQRKIVEILDQFHTLTTSLTEGIPAEIEARRQQYQYYRDKLLSFKEKKET